MALVSEKGRLLMKSFDKNIRGLMVFIFIFSGSIKLKPFEEPKNSSPMELVKIKFGVNC